jgi:8-oxo-dGTP pyrophosphatase MutT (NUDIX family)
MATRRVPSLQAAAIPVHAGRVCLVTSRRGKGLVFPKGRLESGRTIRQIALQEAWEEAGVIGVLREKRLGFYRYQKSGKRFEVAMFLMDVTNVRTDWPESYKRTRYWLALAEAASCVRERGLRKLLRKALANGLDNDKLSSGALGRTRAGRAADTRDLVTHSSAVG